MEYYYTFYFYYLNVLFNFSDSNSNIHLLKVELVQDGSEVGKVLLRAFHFDATPVIGFKSKLS